MLWGGAQSELDHRSFGLTGGEERFPHPRTHQGVSGVSLKGAFKLTEEIKVFEIDWFTGTLELD